MPVVVALGEPSFFGAAFRVVAAPLTVVTTGVTVEATLEGLTVIQGFRTASSAQDMLC